MRIILNSKPSASSEAEGLEFTMIRIGWNWTKPYQDSVVFINRSNSVTWVMYVTVALKLLKGLPNKIFPFLFLKLKNGHVWMRIEVLWKIEIMLSQEIFISIGKKNFLLIIFMYGTL